MSTHSEIISVIPACFEKAKSSGDLLFYPSDVHVHEDSGLKFQIRLCPALLHKPTLPTPHFDSSNDRTSINNGKQKDPFKPPYNPNLLVGELKDENEGTEYVILLNKYSVVPHHFLLITKEYQSQASPLLPTDLVHAYSILLAARKKGKEFFAFYNCGDRSGASQPHKHIQFIPIEDEDGPPIERLAMAARIQNEEKPFSLPTLSFAHHIRRLSIRPSTDTEQIEQQLSSAFIELLDLCISTIRHEPDYPAGAPSYNVVLTLGHMHLVPRRQEAHVLVDTGERVSVNALGFAGMMLVKCEEELAAVMKEGPSNILRGVGCGSVHELQAEGGVEFDGDAKL